MKKIYFLLCPTMLSIAPFSQQINPRDKKHQGVSCDHEEVRRAKQKMIAACPQNR